MMHFTSFTRKIGMKVLKLSEEHNQIIIITGNMHFYLLTEINRQRSKILTLDAWLLASRITLAALFCSFKTRPKFSLSQLVQIEIIRAAKGLFFLR